MSQNDTGLLRKGKSELVIEVAPIKKAALLVRAVNHPMRQKMLQTMAQEGAIKVSALYRRLNLQQGAASMHLTMLRRAGVVVTQKEGTHVWYRVNTDRLEELHQLVARFIKK